MPAPFGVTVSGFSAKTQEELLAEIEEAERANISPTLKTTADTVIGQINGIFSGKLRELWELAQAVYASFDPDAATGAAQDAIAAISGTLREPAAKGTVTLSCALVAGTTLEAGVHFAEVAGDPANRWTPIADFTAPANGSHEIPSQSEFAGAAATANAGTITVISTPVVGWLSLTNAMDAIEGTDVESDPLFRVRREAEITQQAGSPVDGIRADLLTVPGVIQVTVFENPTPAIDADGLPPHSFEAVVQGGTDQAVADQIFASKAAGIRAFGNDETVTVEDSRGNTHTIEFSRPVVRLVWIEMDLTYDPDIYVPATADVALETALAAFGDETYQVGDNVIRSKLFDVAFDAVAGIEDVTAIRLGFAPSPVGVVNLVIAARELADLDTGRILITSTSI